METNANHSLIIQIKYSNKEIMPTQIYNKYTF